ncbi:DUF2946 family protein [Pseudomonas sp. X10]
MKLARQDRSLIAWALYASVLFSLLVCGLHHGQMAGLSLSGLDGAFCSLTADHGPSVDPQGSGPDAMAQFSCPLCSSFGLAVIVDGHGWTLGQLPGTSVAPIVVRSWAQPPPRQLWPSLNPRASPHDFPAANPTA